MKKSLATRLFGTAAITLALGVASLFGSAAQATVIHFGAITANNVGDAGIVEGGVTVTSTGGASTVSFLLEQASNGTSQPTVANLFFQDTNGLFTTINSIVNGTGVDWAAGSNPSDLPAGASISPAFHATSALDSSANNPAPSKGVNPGEHVTVILNLANGKTAADVDAALLDGSLRIGLHVINFASGSSESYVNTPEPASMATAALGLGLVALRRRRKA